MTEPQPNYDRPPLFGSWARIYAVIIVWLAICIAGLAWLTLAF
jgi:hypothetical protein